MNLEHLKSFILLQNQQNKVKVKLEHKTLFTAKMKCPQNITDVVRKAQLKATAKQRTYENIYKHRKCGLKYSNHNKYAWIWIIEMEPKSECKYKMAMSRWKLLKKTCIRVKNTLCLLLVNIINSRMTSCNQPRTDYQNFLLKDLFTQVINSPYWCQCNLSNVKWLVQELE